MRLSAIESKIDLLQKMSISQLVHGPFYMILRTTASFFAADVSWYLA
jgi:hypothetical protein